MLKIGMKKNQSICEPHLFDIISRYRIPMCIMCAFSDDQDRQRTSIFPALKIK